MHNIIDEFILDQCPEGSFKHPFKPRCYIVFNSLKNYYKAAKYCRFVKIEQEHQHNSATSNLQHSL